MSIYVLPFWILLPCLVVAAYVWGARPERSVALLFAAAAAASIVPATRTVGSWVHLEAWILLVDTLLLASLCFLVIRYERWWITLAASFQTISTLAHLARLLNPRFDRVAYALMEGVSSYPTLLILAFAIWRSSMGSSSAAAPKTRSARPNVS